MITKQRVKTSFVVIAQPPFLCTGAKEIFPSGNGPLQGANRLPFMAEPQYYHNTWFDKKQTNFSPL